MFSEVSILDVFLFWGAEWAQNAYTSVNWDPPSKNTPSEKGWFGGGPEVARRATLDPF